MAEVVRRLPGAGEVVIAQPGHTDMMEFLPNRALMLRYMVTGDQVNHAVSIGLAGRAVGRIDEGDRFYPLVVRVAESGRTNPETLNVLPLHVADGSLVVGLGNVGKWQPAQSVAAITREQAARREAILVAVENTDVAGFVARARAAIQSQVRLPEGYHAEFSGAYKNWESGSRRLAVSGARMQTLATLRTSASLNAVPWAILSSPIARYSGLTPKRPDATCTMTFLPYG